MVSFMLYVFYHNFLKKNTNTEIHAEQKKGEFLTLGLMVKEDTA